MAEKIKADERLINLILCLLQSKKPLSAVELRYNPQIGYDPTAEDKTFERMFERDKQAIEELGFDLQVHQGTYSLDSSSSCIHKVELSNSELAYLQLLAKTYLAQRNFPYKDELRFALNKLNASIASCLSEDEEEKLLFEEDDDGAAETISKTPARPPKNSGAELLQQARKLIDRQNAQALPSYNLQELINNAISQQKILCFSYRNMQGIKSQRCVHPYFSYYQTGIWYFIAYDPDKSSMRTFRADNCTDMYIKHPKKKSPDFKKMDVDFDGLIQLPFQYGDEESFEAHIVIPHNESWKAKHITHEKGSLSALNTGELEWRISCADSDALVRFCLDEEANLVPVHPPRLHQLYLSYLHKLTEIYHG